MVEIPRLKVFLSGAQISLGLWLMNWYNYSNPRAPSWKRQAQLALGELFNNAPGEDEVSQDTPPTPAPIWHEGYRSKGMC